MQQIQGRIGSHTRRTLFFSFLFGSVFLISCEGINEMNQRRETAKIDLSNLESEVPPPPAGVYLRSEHTSDIGRVVNFRTFKSQASCDLLHGFYRDYFISKGWDVNRMSQRQSRGGMDSIDFDFRDSEYLISVSCQSDVREEDEKQITIMYSWGFR